MALAKSVNKLLLAASASKAPLIVLTSYFMFAVGLIYVHFRANLCLQFSILGCVKARVQNLMKNEIQNLVCMHFYLLSCKNPITF